MERAHEFLYDEFNMTFMLGKSEAVQGVKDGTYFHKGVDDDVKPVHKAPKKK